MIGGYLFRKIDEDIRARLESKLANQSRVRAWDFGFLFFNRPAPDGASPCAASPDTIVLSEDLLIGSESDLHYRQINLDSDFLPACRKDFEKTLDSLQCDFRMAVVSRKGSHCSLQLVSHRAGAGRMYYHRLADGILFCSDLRFLLEVVPFEANHKGIYSILKYGSIPDPMTISRNISSVPAAHYADFDLNNGTESVRPFFQFRFGCRGNRQQVSLGRAQSALKASASFLSEHSPAMLLSGGIDSSLFGCYLNEARKEPLKAFYCAFGPLDPEYPYAAAIAQKLGVELNIATMEGSDALQSLEDVVRFSDHPFSDFSSLPIVFLMKFLQRHMDPKGIIIECNGGDDCFGFAALGFQSKFRYKHAVPRALKKTIAAYLQNFPHWKWESHEGWIARIAALADVHEISPCNYFLVQAPVHFMDFQVESGWDEDLQSLIEGLSRSCSRDYEQFGYEEKITVRQLLFINSPRWTAKALSVSESLGIRLAYPFLWRDLLLEQGRIPWEYKIRNGIVKWPLKKLLEDYMQSDFIYRKKSGFVPPLVHWLTDRSFNQKARDMVLRRNGYVSEIIPARLLEELFTDALNNHRLRTPLLNTLWGAIFTEAWIQEHGKIRGTA